MPEISERERKERAAARAAKPKNPDDLKVIFRCTPERKRKLQAVAKRYGMTMTDVLNRSIDAAWHGMEAREGGE